MLIKKVTDREELTMGAILKTLVNRSRMIIERMFGEDRRESRISLVKPKPDKELYRNIVLLLKGNPDFPACKTDARLLHRRLKQYQRLGWHAGSEARMESLRRLEKQWKKVVLHKMKRIKFENDRRNAIAGETTGKIIPVSHKPGK